MKPVVTLVPIVSVGLPVTWAAGPRYQTIAPWELDPEINDQGLVGAENVMDCVGVSQVARAVEPATRPVAICDT